MRLPILAFRSGAPKAAETYCLHILSDLSATAVQGCRVLSPKPNGCRRLLPKSCFFFRISPCFLISPSSSPISFSFSLSLIKTHRLLLDFSSTRCFPPFLLCSFSFLFLLSLTFLLFFSLSPFCRSQSSEKWCNRWATTPHRIICAAPQANDVSHKYCVHRVRSQAWHYLYLH